MRQIFGGETEREVYKRGAAALCRWLIGIICDIRGSRRKRETDFYLLKQFCNITQHPINLQSRFVHEAKGIE